MMTKTEVLYLNNILSLLPTNGGFRVSNYIEDVFADPEFLYLGDVTAEIRRASGLISQFLKDKEFASFDGDDFSSDLTPYHSRTLILEKKGIDLKNAGSFQNYMKIKNIVQESSQWQRLNWILDYMAKNAETRVGLESAWSDIKMLHPTIHIEYNEAYRQQMIDKLINDKYIEPVVAGYRITWAGSLFNDEGGYVAQFCRQNDERNRLDRVENSALTNRRFTLWLTIVIAIGNIFSSLYYVQETKRLNWLFSFNAMVCLWVFLFGLVGGLMLYLIREEIISRKK